MRIRPGARASVAAMLALVLGSTGLAWGAESEEAIPEPTPAQIRAALGQTQPRAALIYDMEADRVLWGRNAETALPAASLIKMVTAVVAADALDPETQITISARAARTRHDRLQWREGATFTVDQVMHGMLLESSNGAAVALAEATAGSVPAFAERANAWLRQRGLTGTTLVDPSGLDASGQEATAHDLAIVAAALLRDPWLSGVVATRSFGLPWPDGGRATFGNINQYLHRDGSAIGVKNGFTSGAGNTLAAASRRNGRTHLVLVLDSAEVYDVAARLMDLAFELRPGSPDLASEAVQAAPREQSLLGQPSPAGTPEARDEARPAATARPETRAGMPRTIVLLVFAAYAAWVFALRKRQQRLLRQRRRAARRAPPEPEPVVIEYPLIEWDLLEEREPGWDPLSRAR